MGSSGSHPWGKDLTHELSALEERSLLRSILTPETGQEPHITIDGRRLAHFTSNNYLGLSTHPRLIDAAVDATRRYGTSVSASRLLCGSTPLHEELETKLARLKRQQACLLYSAGYLANIGVIASLAGPGDAIFSDALNHASIIDACRLARAEATVYRHLDLNHLEALLRESNAKRKMIVTESVFSMDGDLAPVPELIGLAEGHNALLLLDEAHATGLLGPDGAGSLSHFGLAEAGNVVIVGTLSKALGAVGGFVAAERTIVSYLLNRSRSFIFTTGMTPAAVAAAGAAVDLLEEEPWRRERALALAARLRDGLVERGYPETQSVTQIVPQVIGDAAEAVTMERRLRGAGVLARAIRPPTVPEGTSRVRFNVMATHTEADIQTVLDAVAAPAPTA